MSKIKRHLEDWLIDNQINGDDGSGYCDTCAGCNNCMEVKI